MTPEEAENLSKLFSEEGVNVWVPYNHPWKGSVKEFALAIYPDEDENWRADFESIGSIPLEDIPVEDVIVLRRIEEWWKKL